MIILRCPVAGQNLDSILDYSSGRKSKEMKLLEGVGGLLERNEKRICKAIEVFLFCGVIYRRDMSVQGSISDRCMQKSLHRRFWLITKMQKILVFFSSWKNVFWHFQFFGFEVLFLFKNVFETWQVLSHKFPKFYFWVTSETFILDLGS